VSNKIDLDANLDVKVGVAIYATFSVIVSIKMEAIESNFSCLLKGKGVDSTIKDHYRG
jgi:hypothetical protein